MAQVQIAAGTDSGELKFKEVAENRTLFFNDNHNTLKIKYSDEMIPIAGDCKQDKLTAGDNIEINEDTDVIRLADDITVKTCTISPSDKISSWKGTVKIGELHSNSVLLLVKESQVASSDKGIIGGEVLIKHIVGEETKYSHYIFTITSTGSWTLKGGIESEANVRVCKAKYNNEWYYGLKVPDITKVNVTRTLINHNNVASQTLCIQIGTSDNNSFGSRKIFIGEPGQGRTSLLLSRSINVSGNSNYNSWYYRKFSDIIDNMHLNQYMANGMLGEIQDWYRKGYYLNFWIYTQRNSNNNNQVQVRIHDILVTKTPINSAAVEADPDNIVYDFNLTNHRATYQGLDFYGRNGAVSNVGNLLNNTSSNLTVFNFGGQSQDGQSANNQGGSYADLATFTISYQQEEVNTATETQAIDSSEFWFNGWKDIPASLTPPEGYNDSQITYEVLSAQSQSDEHFTDVITLPNISGGSVVANTIQNLGNTGEDGSPYRLNVSGNLTYDDLVEIGNLCRNPEKQIYLDLSNATVIYENNPNRDARNWNGNFFKNCVSLRGIKLPKGVQTIVGVEFLWCTYLREIDLSACRDTLTTIGASEAYGTSIGLLTSTRVRNLIIPKSVSLLRNYLVGSSNIKDLIFTYNNREQMSVSEWTFTIWNDKQALIDTLPENFHLFIPSPWYNNYLLPNLINNNSQNWVWNNANSYWTRRLVSSIVLYNPNSTQSEWQEFADNYGWDEDLVNKVRHEFGYIDNIEIIKKKD